MSDEKKIIIYQVLTRLFGTIIIIASITVTLFKMAVERWQTSQ